MSTRLLEREAELDVLVEALASAAAGLGGGVAVTGESGAGKSALVARALEAVPSGVRVLRGHCDPLHTPRPLGPFRALGFESLAQGDDPVRVSELGERVYEELAARPTVLVVEDLHWVDELSADLLRFLARRVESAPLALVMTYRDLEVGPRHPVRPLLGDVAALDGLRTLTLQPLSVGAVEALVEGTGLDPVRVREVTGGNPFFVSALVREPDQPMPGSVRDAVLARIVEVDPADLEVLQLVAAAPDGLDDRVLPALGVDLPALRRLDAMTLLSRTDSGLVFRHELARLALLSTVPPGGAAVLHGRLLAALEALHPQDPAVLTHHAVAARDAEKALRHARAAAAEAAAASSNTEAAAFLQIALEHLPAAAPAEERAELLTALSHHLYVTSRVSEAIATARASIPLWDAADRPTGVARVRAAVALYEYQMGRRSLSDEQADRACEIALATGDPDTIAYVHTETAIIAVTYSDTERARMLIAQIQEAAETGGLPEYALAVQLLTAGMAAMAGEPEGRELTLRHVATAREHQWDQIAWYGFVLAIVSDILQFKLRRAQRVIDEVMSFAVERDLAVARHWNLSFRAILNFWTGRWQAAVEDTEAVVADAGLRSMYLPLVLAVVDLRCHGSSPADRLDDCWALTRTLDTPQRSLAALAGLAEAMWMSGEPDSRVTEYAVEHLAELAAPPDCRWVAGELAVWLRRLGLPHDARVDLPEPYRSHLEGRHREAADWWQSAGGPFQEAMALADSADPDDRVRAVALLDRAGATATADRLRVELRRDGLEAVPQRPRESTRANPGGLTNRQLDVARLVARGLSNSEIATRLYISPKTADHHVSAILAKLELPNRRAVVVHADGLGLS